MKFFLRIMLSSIFFACNPVEKSQNATHALLVSLLQQEPSIGQSYSPIENLPVSLQGQVFWRTAPLSRAKLVFNLENIPDYQIIGKNFKPSPVVTKVYYDSSEEVKQIKFLSQYSLLVTIPASKKPQSIYVVCDGRPSVPYQME